MSHTKTVEETTTTEYDEEGRIVRQVVVTVEEVPSKGRRVVSEQPYGPGAMCDECGHFAGRHGPDGCPGVNNGCDCPGMLWLGVRWPRPWLPAPEGLVAP